MTPRHRARLLSLLLAIALCLAGAGDDWPTYLHDSQRTAAQNETVLSPATAPRLVKLWSFQTGGMVAASPTVVGNTVYIGSWDGNEYALDAATGAIKWKTFIGLTTSPASDCLPSYGVTSSATVQNGVVYVGGGDAYWYALDAVTGAILWTVFTGDNSPAGGHYNWASPLLYNGFAYVGVASLCDDPLVQGQLLQIDLSSHQITRTFNVVPDGQVGGGIWTSPSVDPATNTIFVTTGNAGQEPATSQPYAQAMLALDDTTLAVKGSWQAPQDAAIDDQDWSTTPTIFDDATGRPLVAAMNKTGQLYAFDRRNVGAGPIWQQPIASGGDCPECGDGSVSSAAIGQGRLFAAGGNTLIGTVPYSGSVQALDPSTGQPEWEHGTTGAVVAALAYDNGLVLDGANTTFEVLNATTGSLLYRYGVGSSITGAPAVSNGRIFLGTAHGTVDAFGAATIALAPASGRVGDTVTMSGSLFAPSEPISVYVDGVRSTPVVTTTAGVDGSATCQFTVPMVISGTHTIIAVGQRSGRWATAPFRVKPRLLLRPGTGASGSTMTAIGLGFGPQDQITIYWDTSAQVLGTAVSGVQGTFSTGLQIPSSTVGMHVVVAVARSGAAALSIFAVRQGSKRELISLAAKTARSRLQRHCGLCRRGMPARI